jgi:CxxC-x17-CxxC domain-containing protein
VKLMSYNRGTKSSYNSNPTSKTAIKAKSKDGYKTRDKPKYKSGAKPNNRSRDRADNQTRRRSPPRSRRKPTSQSRDGSSKRNYPRSGNRSQSRTVQQHKVICSKCKKETTVPFKPTGTKPVYCRECFQDQKPNRDFRQSNKQSRTQQPHQVMCASCGKDTTVPFRPTGVKPVYCRECFESKDIQKESRQTRSKRVFRASDKTSKKPVERFGDRKGPYRTNKRMHSAVCRTCNKEITLPFKPTKDKPVYCQDCFQKIKPKQK